MTELEPSPSPSRQSACVVAVANQKGGVGKTTTAVNLAVLLARRSYRVLLIDADPQGNATSSLGLSKRNLPGTIYDALLNADSIASAITPSVRANLDLLPATQDLAGVEVELVSLADRAQRLSASLDLVRDRYDVIIIDCPPSLGLLTVNALSASDYVLVPIQCEYLALEGLSQLVATVDLIRRELNPDLDVIGILMTMYDARTRLSANVVEEVRRYFPQRIFRSIIPRSIRLAEAPSYGQSIAEYDAASRGALAYELVADELADRLQLPGRVPNQIGPAPASMTLAG